MELTVELLLAILLGVVVFAALVRWLYLTGRSLWWGEESIDNLPEHPSETDPETTAVEPAGDDSDDETDEV